MAAFSLTPASAALPADFETDEYYASRALDVINASEAYALGYTGLGQTIGILDTAVRVDHPELAGRADTMPLLDDGQALAPIWDGNNLHGTHVAGIAAAKRDGLGMHGVAFDSQIWAGFFLSDYDALNLTEYFARRPEVRIFNNSWSSSSYIASFDDLGNEISLDDYLVEIFIG